MKFSDFFSLLVDRRSRGTCLCSLLTLSALLLAIFVILGSFLAPDQKIGSVKWELTDNLQIPKVYNCKDQHRPSGSEALPEGIVSKTSNLNMRPLWGFPKSKNTSVSLFALAVGLKQKDLVDKMVRKFLYSGFAVMLFHYDGIVDEWKNFGWSENVIHVSARNQTKWWFAKRFLHPDIVAEYSYIFLWDEDLGVENFDPKRYLAIIKSEGLQISQPALDPEKSDVHHQITARVRKSILHRRTFKPGVNGTGCDSKSKAPPCTGWIEMMAPVFSRVAWRCVWYMIQNDLIHAWGLDIQLGYCAQGDRTKNIGIVDAEYVVHYNRPTLGGPNGKNNTKVQSEHENKSSSNHSGSSSHSHWKYPRRLDPRVEVRRQSYIELDIFRKRWKRAVQKDVCWVDPYQDTSA